MPRIYDLIGERFGKLLVIDCLGSMPDGERTAIFWECRCECGEKAVVKTASLMNGSTRSCGCLVSETARKSSYRDLTGQKFGMLTAISPTHVDGRMSWVCKCDCGNERIVSTGRLTTDNAYSCGCTRRESVAHIKHGMANTRIYAIFKGMRARCNNENHPYYPNYGGRGIKVCDEWMLEDGFIRFYQWSMDHGYEDDLTIDRINNNGGYAPDNCRWVGMSVQANNKRSSQFVEYDGQTLTIGQWAKRLDVPYHTLYRKLKKLPSDEVLRGYINAD